MLYLKIVIMKNQILLLTISLFCFSLQAQPLFKLKSTANINTNVNGYNLGSERYDLCLSDSNGLIITPLFTYPFDSYLWDFGDGTTSTAYNPQKHHYQNPGNYLITLTVSAIANPFRILSNLSLLQTNSSWKPQCSSTESLPDFYYEYYDLNGELIFQTPVFSNTPVPINQTISGIITQKNFTIKVYEEDLVTFNCLDFTDEYLGEVSFPINSNTGIYQDLNDSLKFSATFTNALSTTFSIPVNVYTSSSTIPIIQQSGNCLISDISGNWLDDNSQIIAYNTNTYCPTQAGNYRVTNGTALCTSISDPFSFCFTPIINVNSPTICAGQSATLTAIGATSYLWSNGASGSSITVNPSSTTTYTVIGTTNGCSTLPINALVTVNSAPVVTVANQNICTGQSTTLTASGAASYQWSNGASGSSITVSPTSTTTYTVTGTSGGCPSLPANALVTVNSTPVVSVTNQTICAGQSTALTASGAASYQWSNGATGSSITVSPTSTTTYTVTGTSGGCPSLPANALVTVNSTPVVSVTNQTICAGQSTTLTASGAASYQWSNGTSGSSITVSPTSTTTYTVTGTSGGCPSLPANALVTVNQTPVVSVGNKVICEGQITTLTASGAASYQWSNGAIGSNITVSPTSTTTYTVTGTSSGCPSLPANALVTVNPIPVVSVSNQTICAGQSTTLTASGAASYQWSNGATGSSITVSPTSTTTYTVTGISVGCPSLPANALVTVNPTPNDSIYIISGTIRAFQGEAIYQWYDCVGNEIITNANNQTFIPTVSGEYALIISDGVCSDTSDCLTFEVTDIADIKNDVVVLIYPNPTTGIATIQLANPMENVEILVFDDLGKIVHVVKTQNEKEIQLNLTQLPVGLYIGRLIHGESLYTFKIEKY